MYVEGTTDLSLFILPFPFLSPEDQERQLVTIKEKATKRYFPVYEKVSVNKEMFLDQGSPTIASTCFVGALQLQQSLAWVEVLEGIKTSGKHQFLISAPHLGYVVLFFFCLKPGLVLRGVPSPALSKDVYPCFT